MKLLVVEDEPKMAALLRKGLEEEGYAVTVAADGPTGLEYAQTSDFDLIVLDVMLPRMDGFEVARRLRARHNRTPILMLTARDAAPDVVKGLNLGADDYVTKPFSLEILLARVRAVARRGPIAQPVRLRVADLVLDLGTHEAIRGGERIPLTKTEFSLLEALMRRAGQVVERAALIEAVWGFEKDIESNTLDAFISLLRSKVDHGSRPKLIQTVRGIGFSVRMDRDA
ncbi:MAG: response regulator transcription factor [Acidobacteria bacterium]|nr:response regulator transcription factor [Acidobacteriota bacterium]